MEAATPIYTKPQIPSYDPESPLESPKPRESPIKAPKPSVIKRPKISKKQGNSESVIVYKN